MTVTRDLGTTATLRELAQHRWDVAAAGLTLVAGGGGEEAEQGRDRRLSLG